MRNLKRFFGILLYAGAVLLSSAGACMVGGAYRIAGFVNLALGLYVLYRYHKEK